VLSQEIKTRMLQALKAGRTVEKEILRVALGEIQTQEARTSDPMTDEQAQAIVRKLVKSNQETLASSEDDEQKRVLVEEIAILESLLPKSLGVDDIIAALAPVAEGVKAAGNDGQATGVAMKHLKASGATVNGKDVSEAVRQMRAK
jgi:uncharacterized protein YqeY